MTAKCGVKEREGRGNEMTSRAAASNARGAETETKQRGSVEEDVEWRAVGEVDYTPTVIMH
jgi:hypothetical protein